jgi:predicted DNA-binding protein
MSVSLSRDAERRLSVLAERTGRTASDLIEEGIDELEGRYLPDERARERQGLPANETARKQFGIERAAAWRDAARNLPRTPPLSDEAISRDSMYENRG